MLDPIYSIDTRSVQIPKMPVLKRFLNSTPTAKINRTAGLEIMPIKNLIPKNPDQDSLARAERKLAEAIKKEPTVSKVVKKAARLADLMTEQDRADNMRVLREAKDAMHHVYDKDLQRLVERPDHKTRLAAATLQLAYDEGLPVQRQVVMAKTFKSADELIEKVKQSPALMEAIKAMNRVGVNVTAAGRIIDVETHIQKRGSESEGDSTEKIQT